MFFIVKRKTKRDARLKQQELENSAAVRDGSADTHM